MFWKWKSLSQKINVLECWIYTFMSTIITCNQQRKRKRFKYDLNTTKNIYRSQGWNILEITITRKAGKPTFGFIFAFLSLLHFHLISHQKISDTALSTNFMCSHYKQLPAAFCNPYTASLMWFVLRKVLSRTLFPFSKMPVKNANNWSPT